MAVKHFDVMSFGKALINPEQLGYHDSIEIIKDESLKVQKSFVKIGWYLKHIRDNELYKENGYDSVWECAADQLGYSQSTASRFINICEKFSKDHNSPELDTKYAGFDKSQMIEMLPMEPEQLDKVTPDMTVKQIRDIKAEGKELKEVSEQISNDSDIPGQTSIEKDFPEYLPEEKPVEQEKEKIESYATSHKENDSSLSSVDLMDKDKIIDGEYREIKEPEAAEEEIATSQPDKEEVPHNEEWFVRRYVEICSSEAAKLFEICHKEQNNSDRAKAIQKHISPYGGYYHGCSEYDFDFHGFSAGMDFRIGDEKIHLKYGRFVVELMKLLDKETAESAPKDDFAVTKYILEQEKKTLDDMLKIDDLPEMTILRQKTIVAALASMVCDLENNGFEPEPQPELPILKNNDQRKEWLADYKAWGLWYRDEHIDVNYYKYDFSDGSRLVVTEYPQRYGYWNDKRSDEHYYHLLEKNKKSYKKTYDEQYRNQIDSETYLIEFLKNIQKKG